MTLQVVSVVGARPQFVKAAVVSRALRGVPGLRELIVHTGQHFDDNMSEVFFRELGIPAPDRNLGVASLGHGAMTGRMLEAIEQVLLEARPDWVVVFGDTNSTLAGALAAAKLGIKVAHVEAGLRSFNWRMPEEINRVLADRLSDLLFVPTETAVENLRAEGIDPRRVRLVGDVMYDAALHYGAQSAGRALARLGLAAGAFVLATVHRQENTDDAGRLAAIFGGLARAGVPVVAPLHPRTRAALARAGLLAEAEARLRLIEPVGYLDMLELERAARLIVTDSGGVQKEAYFARVPCVTLRDETEWVELVRLGVNRLVPPVSADAVAAAIREALASPPAWPAADLYGGGAAAGRIAEAIASA